MGFAIGRWLLKESPDKSLFEELETSKNGFEPSHVAHVLKAATLAHDIGNPPFGHGGESFIQCWFRSAREIEQLHLSEAQKQDFFAFEGNAQGFRILTDAEKHKGKGGLRLTYATLATFTKYPCSSTEAKTQSIAGTNQYCGWKKHGFFEAEKGYFENLADKTGLLRDAERFRWKRHPLSYLVEAADDIAFKLADLEDGVELGLMSTEQVACLLRDTDDSARGTPLVTSEEQQQAKDAYGLDHFGYVANIRARAQHRLVCEVVELWKGHYEEIMTGNFDKPLLKQSRYNKQIECIKEKSREHIFESPRQIRRELAGKSAVDGLLRFYAMRLCELKSADYSIGKLDKSSAAGGYFRLMRRSHAEVDPFEGMSSREDNEDDRDYRALLCVTDWIAGMADRYCIELYRNLKGIDL